jgi:hypothetical protein
VRRYPHFGAINPADIPDFDLGRNLSLQDQEKDNAPTECTGYTAAHILSAIFNVRFSPDFSFAANRYITGEGPGVDGASFHGAMDALVGYGGLPLKDAPFDAKTTSELYISDFGRWSPTLPDSRAYVQNGVRNVLGFGDAFDSILSAISQGGIPVSVGSPWFPEWTTGIDQGIVRMPDISNTQGDAWHNYTADGKTTINAVPYLIVYSHQGNRVGDDGKLYFSRETVNAALSIPGSGALSIDPHAIRFISLLGILAIRFPAILPQLPALVKAGL